MAKKTTKQSKPMKGSKPDSLHIVGVNSDGEKECDCVIHAGYGDVAVMTWNMHGNGLALVMKFEHELLEDGTLQIRRCQREMFITEHAASRGGHIEGHTDLTPLAKHFGRALKEIADDLKRDA